MHKLFKSRVAAVATGAAVVVGLGATGAVAADMVTSNEIRNGAVQKEDIHRNAIGVSELDADAVLGRNIVDGEVGVGELSAWVRGELAKAATPGASAYEIAVEGGYTGTQEEWVASLKGADGANGNDGINGTNGADGMSAYEIAVAGGYSGTEEEWVASLNGVDGVDGLNGKDGVDGKSAYEIWESQQGNAGKSVDEFLASLKGEKGEQGLIGPVGPQGVPGDPASDVKGGLAGHGVTAQPVTIDLIGGSINTRYTDLHTGAELQPGTYFVNVSGAFFRSAASTSPDVDVYPQVSLWIDKNHDSQFQYNANPTLSEGSISPNALVTDMVGRHVSASGATVITLTEPTYVGLVAHGYTSTQGSEGSGEIQTVAELTALQVK